MPETKGVPGFVGEFLFPWIPTVVGFSGILFGTFSFDLEVTFLFP